jgi:hypothetical protein
MLCKQSRLAYLLIPAALLFFLTGCGGGGSNKKLPPAGLTATAGTAQVTLSWSAPSTSTLPASYNLYYATAAGVTSATGTKIPGLTTTTYTQTGLTAGTTYYYVVTAVYASGESAPSNVTSATPTAPAMPPSAPTGLTAAGGNAQVALNWSASSGATSYNLYYATASGVTPANGTKISGITATSYTQSGLTNGTTYYYVVTAVGSGGESTASSQASATPTAPPPPASPDLSIALTTGGTFTAGSNGVFQIAVRNVGTASTTGTITVADTLPSGFAYVSATGTNWTCAAASQTVTCTNPGPIAKSAAAANITLTVGISSSATGTISDTATVSDPGDTTDTADKSSNASATIGAPPSGMVITGTTPISGATIQLYAVGTASGGSASTPLLTGTVETDSSGNFVITNLFTCPTPETLVYLTATGGNPGLASGTNNAALLLMTALGACSTVTSAKPIVINEMTTVASVFALETYMTSPITIGSSAADATDLANDFASVNELVDITKGTTPGPALPANESVTVATLNTLADILAACVETAGGVAGDGSACGNLFTAATPPAPITSAATAAAQFANARAPQIFLTRTLAGSHAAQPEGTTGPTAPTNTASATQNVAANPTSNVAALSAVASSTGPYEPQQTSIPSSWNVIAVPGVGSSSTNFSAASLPADVYGAVGTTSVFFTTVINNSTTSQTLTASPITLSPLPIALSACATDPVSNQCLSTPSSSSSVTIQPGTYATFATFITVSAAIPFNPVNNVVYLTFADSHGTVQAFGYTNINTTLNVESLEMVAATPTGNGVLTIPLSQGQEAGTFVVASANFGGGTSPSFITAAAGTLPVTITLCETNSVGQCLGPPVQVGGGGELAVSFPTGTAETFSVFVTATAAIPSEPNNRIYVQFTDANGNILTFTSVAVITQ